MWGRLRSGVIYVREALAGRVLPPCLGPPGHPNDLLPVRVFLDRLSRRQLLRLSPELFPLLPLSRVGGPRMQEHLARWWRWASSRLGDRSSEALDQQRDLLCRF